MKILMIVAYFPPEIGSAAHVYFDLARAFVKRGHEVDIITSYPRDYNLNNEDVSKVSLHEEIINDITVHRVKHPHTRDNFIIRGLEHFLLPRYYFRRYKQLKKNFDVCLFYIPPLPLYYLAKKIKRYDGTFSVLNFQDFHPQELTDVGILKNSIIIKILEHIEREAYKNADYITVLSPGGIDYILERGGHSNKTFHIYNGFFLSDHEKNFSQHTFKKKEGIENKFLISYAGILSPFQGIDNILDVAKQLLDHLDIIFYIVGDGMIKNHLEQRIADEQLTNIKLLPLQPRDEYYNIINSSDINFISLDERMKAPCIPGKIINLMAFKQPIIAIVAQNTETANLVREARCGMIVQPGNIESIKSVIIHLKGDESLRKKMGENGKEYLVNNMNLEKNVIVYEQIFHQILGDNTICVEEHPSNIKGIFGDKIQDL